jgi:hypothetical protein
VELSSSWLFDTFFTLRWEYSELGSNWIVAKDEGPTLAHGNSNTIVTCYVFHLYEKSFIPAAPHHNQPFPGGLKLPLCRGCHESEQR